MTPDKKPGIYWGTGYPMVDGVNWPPSQTEATPPQHTATSPLDTGSKAIFSSDLRAGHRTHTNTNVTVMPLKEEA